MSNDEFLDWKIEFTPIGIIHSPHKSNESSNSGSKLQILNESEQPKHTIPIQSIGALEYKGYIEIFTPYVAGLKDLDGFSHIFVIYYFHKVKGYSLLGKPYMENKERGIFAIRGPKRPNPIGLSIFEIERIEQNKIFVRGLDVLDGTPVLDIKPYIPYVDCRKDAKIGWLEGKSQKFSVKKSE